MYLFGLSKFAPKFVLSLAYKVNLNYHYYTSELTHEADCPICSCKTAKVFHYGRDSYATGNVLLLDEVSKGHKKYCCTNCRHIYALWLRKDLDTVGNLYSNIYSGESEVYTENWRKEIQKQMVRIAKETFYSGYPKKSEIPFVALDFSCGANFKAAYELRKEGIESYCCDILPLLPYDNNIFFKYDDDFVKKFRNKFHGLTSVDVLEHLNTPIEDFKLFNQMLKLNGVMVHYSPIIDYMPLFGSHVDHVFHTNFFSKKSLKIACEKTGFELIGIVIKKLGSEYYIFKKNREV
jgi:hypothetical protein